MLETFPRGTSLSFVETDRMVFDILWISQRAARDSEISQRYYYNTPVIAKSQKHPLLTLT